MANLSGLKCWYCARPANTRDHKRPRSRGGSCKKSNMVPACKECNTIKNRLNVEEFRAELKRRAEKFESSPHWWKVITILKSWGFKFYGERGGADCEIRRETSSPFRYKWKQKAQRNTGKQAVRIEECAKRGEFAEVQGGLMNQV